ncbi:hypothetical protein PIROE2DRAFT_60937 [Piromyces sp. E2]|nr:hypothetical protein PIROE2DRAFT_60937 [Piromyces sp. E2]|eukprot:OUM64023.1 hypothetical protein PIROE2DRAFT_60937 [Piromyces sp. E2]
MGILLKDKDKKEVPKIVIEFFKKVIRKYDLNIKYFKTDNDREFRNKKIKNFCSRNGTNFGINAVNYGNYLYNFNPHKDIGNTIPNEILFEKKIDLKYVKTFGCITHYKDFSQDKFEKDSKEGIFLGLSFKHDCYIIMNRHDYKMHHLSMWAKKKNTTDINTGEVYAQIIGSETAWGSC